MTGSFEAGIGANNRKLRREKRDSIAVKVGLLLTAKARRMKRKANFLGWREEVRKIRRTRCG